MQVTYMNRKYSVEDLCRYTPGGYHPIDIGDELHNGRYRVLHKLGHGTFATVWLALNKHFGQDGAPLHLYVALKILVADANTNAQQPAEVSILRNLVEHPVRPEHPGSEFVLSLLERFEIEGPNGTHSCIVTEVLGPTASSLFVGPAAVNPLPLELARIATAGLIKAVAFLHSRGVVHGDLHPGNITLGASKTNYWNVSGPQSDFKEPIKIPLEEIKEISRGPSVPQHAIPSLWVGPASRIVLLTPIRIIDFGQSWESTAPPFPLPKGRKPPGTPEEMAAPELLLGVTTEVDAAIDIWALACMVFRLFGDHSLFSLWRGNRNEVLADIVALLGTMPKRWWNKFESCGKSSCPGVVLVSQGKFTGDWEPGHDLLKERAELTLEKRVKTMRNGDLEGDDEAVILMLLRAILKFEPKERATAAQLMEMLPPEWEEGMPACLPARRH